MLFRLVIGVLSRFATSASISVLNKSIIWTFPFRLSLVLANIILFCLALNTGSALGNVFVSMKHRKLCFIVWVKWSSWTLEPGRRTKSVKAYETGRNLIWANSSGCLASRIPTSSNELTLTHFRQFLRCPLIFVPHLGPFLDFKVFLFFRNEFYCQNVFARKFLVFSYWVPENVFARKFLVFFLLNSIARMFLPVEVWKRCENALRFVRAVDPPLPCRDLITLFCTVLDNL